VRAQPQRRYAPPLLAAVNGWGVDKRGRPVRCIPVVDVANPSSTWEGVAHIPRSGEVPPGRRRDVERVNAEMTLPVGTVTFVLGDMASSTRLWEQHPDVMPAVLGRIDVLAGEVLVRHQGARPAEQGEGDNLVAAFGNASDAIRYAAELQAALVA